MKKIFVLDSSVFLDGFNPTNIELGFFVTPRSVVEEIRDIKSKTRLENYLAAKKIIVETPEEENRKKVKNLAVKLGDLFFLSEADIDVIALALSYKLKNREIIILSNDYTIANVSKKLGINVKTYIKQGIKRIRRSVLYCPSCKKRFFIEELTDKKTCPICGSKLIRKRIKIS